MTKTGDHHVVAERIGCSSTEITDLYSRFARSVEDSAVVGGKEQETITFHPERMYITGKYGQKTATDFSHADVLVYVEIDTSDTSSTDTTDLCHQISGQLHDRCAGVIESSLGKTTNTFDIAFFPSENLLDQCSADIRPITEAAVAASGLETYTYREMDDVDKDTTVYSVRDATFVDCMTLCDNM